MSWPTAIRIFCGATAVWSAIRVGYLAFAFSSGPPSPAAELMSTHKQLAYDASLGFHSFTLLIFGLGALLPWKVWHRLRERGSGQEGLGCFVSGFYSVMFLVLLGVFVGSIAGPKYKIWVDLSEESIVRRDTHLLPPGGSKQAVPFSNILLVTGTWVEKSRTYRYLVAVKTNDGSEIELAKGPRETRKTEAPLELSLLAQAIADKSGARLELR